MRNRRIVRGLLPHLNKPVIPYLTEATGSRAGDIAGASILFIGGGELAGLPAQLEALSRPPFAKLPVMLHIDLVNGLANDEAGVRYVATLDRVDGIVTVRQHLAPLARKLGLLSVVRLFLQDGRGVERGVQVVERSQPDAVELLPGVAFLEVADRFKRLPVPCIAGGLIRTPDAVRRIVAAGCRAVSTTDTALWALNRPAANTAADPGDAADPSARPSGV
ncbi:MAG: glycerol-3-phosphate responsive antiterminator [Phycisphaerales bacterium]|nr:glycerol-3-phosphate responsive antiterminator [Phycisphaerales bacterium]